MKRHFLVYLISLLSLVCGAQGVNRYKFLKKIDLPGDGKWDYMSVDDDRQRLYISHGDRVHVLDLTTDKPLAEWSGLEKVHGIAFNGPGDKVYVANTGQNNLAVYSAKTLEKTGSLELPGGKKPDCILFDNYSQKLFVFCGESNNAIIIDTKTEQIIATLALEGKPEFACTDDRGLIYNNLEDKNEVVVIDAKNNKVLRRLALTGGKAPTGIALDKVNGRLMVACEESQKMLVLSTSTGDVVASVPIGAKTDGLIYEQELHLVITSDGAGTATVIQQETPDKYTVIQTIKTRPGLKTISGQKLGHRFFITGAELEKDGKTPVTGTFGVYVCSPDPQASGK